MKNSFSLPQLADLGAGGGDGQAILELQREYTFAFAPYLQKPGTTGDEESNNGLALLLRFA